jgi:mercuric ion transport protein
MKPPISLVGGVLSAIGATACCFGPLLLVTLGFSGVWAARMQGLATFTPLFACITFLFIGSAFHRLYVRPRQCAPGDVCEMPAVLHRQRIAFWVVVALIAFMAAFPLFADYFY